MRIRPFPEQFPSDRMATAAVAGFFLLANPAAVFGDCRPVSPKSENPEGFVSVTSAKLNPLRNLAASSSSVERLSESEAEETGVFEVRKFWNVAWGCNFSSYESGGTVKQLTALHCVSDVFEWVNSDTWESTSFGAVGARIRVAKKMSKILSRAESPEEGDSTVLVGCFPNTRDCYRIKGPYVEIFRKGDESTYGIWLSSEQYSKLVKGRLSATLDGFSGAPALDAEGKVFGSVSATVAADFEFDAEGKCMPSAYAIALAPMKKKPSVFAEGK